MIDKQLKVHSTPGKNEDAGPKTHGESVAGFFRTPDMTTLIANQRHAVEAMTAATEKLLEGATAVSRKQLALHSTLMQQAFNRTFDYLKPEGMRPEKVAGATDASAEAAMDAIRDIASTVLQCNLEALSAFSDRIRRMETPRPADRATPPHQAAAAD